MAKTLLDYAYDYVSSKEGQVAFKDIWAYVIEQAGLTEEDATKKIGRFYTNLMLDGRFVTLGENEWDLRSRHTYDKVHIDMSEVYAEAETSDDDSEEAEDEDEREYNKTFEEPKDESEESSDSETEENDF